MSTIPQPGRRCGRIAWMTSRTILPSGRMVMINSAVATDAARVSATVPPAAAKRCRADAEASWPVTR
ncbi:MAG TPA: hypothetical protein VET84_08150 [Stellaceae bacterium]|nr:hypothetical protein [Stellaceae bacterium]